MRNRKNNSVIVTIIMVMVFLVCAVGSYAAYNSQAFQRGVLRNRDSEDMRFSSNILSPYIVSLGDTKQYETVLYPYVSGIQESERLEIPIRIANHPMNNDNLVSESDITFDLKIQLKDYDPGTQYYLNGTQITDGTITISGITLAGRKANQVQYVMKFTGKDLDKLTIVAEAIPSGSSKILAAYICPCTNSMVNDFSYQGAFMKPNVQQLKELHGFNYEISISTGRAKVTLQWDKNVLAIDKHFLEKLNKRDQNLWIAGSSYIEDSENNSIMFLMDQVLGEDDYVVLFYPVIDLTDKEWNDIDNAVNFSAVEIPMEAQQE